MRKRTLTIGTIIAAVLIIGVVAGALYVRSHRGEKPGPTTDAPLLRQVREMYADYHSESFPQVKTLTVEEAERLRREKNALFVDVRSEEEQAVSMLPGAITDAEFREKPERYTDRPLIGYCTISYRSGVLAKDLREEGIEMMNLRGGVLAWVHAGNEVYLEGKPTRRVHVYGEEWNLLPAGYEAVW
jgi:rhodanese-related sulfurtransferase